MTMCEVLKVYAIISQTNNCRLHSSNHEVRFIIRVSPCFGYIMVPITLKEVTVKGKIDIQLLCSQVGRY
jgi:hypothetical protein